MYIIVICYRSEMMTDKSTFVLSGLFNDFKNLQVRLIAGEANFSSFWNFNIIPTVMGVFLNSHGIRACPHCSAT